MEEQNNTAKTITTAQNIKVVCISDTHNKANEIKLPQGDVLIHSGDFSLRGYGEEVERFNDYLRQSKFEIKIVIAGNHDLTFDTQNYVSQLYPIFHAQKLQQPLDHLAIKAMLTDCIYLEDSSYHLAGYHFYGSPYTPTYNNWAFNLDRDGQDIINKWKQIPTDTDILITHGPPHQILDKVLVGGMHVGCEQLRKTVLERVKPMYHIFGHVHENYGQIKIDNTTFINASSLTIKYKSGLQPPISFTLNNKSNEL